MAKLIRHDFGGIHDALNKMIIDEVKAALSLLPDQMIEGPSLCRIVVSDGDNYDPKDVAVDLVWLHNDKLYFDGHIMQPDWMDPNIEPDTFSGGEGDNATIETDWLDITDFAYLIDQIAEKVKVKIDIEPEKVMVLYEVDENDNTKQSIVAMSETNWKNRQPEKIDKVLREYFDERYAGCDDNYFCYEDEIKQAVDALATGYDAGFNGDSLFWDIVEMI